MNRLKWLFPVLLAVTLLVPNAARAASISIDDTDPGDTITITGSNFTTFSGVLAASETAPVSFSGTWTDAAIVDGHVRFYIVEADDPTEFFQDAGKDKPSAADTQRQGKNIQRFRIRNVRGELAAQNISRYY